MSTCRSLASSIALVLVATGRVAAGDTETGMADRVGSGAALFTGLANSPEANLYTGTLSTGIQISIPPGRKNMTPRLTLQYSSSGGPSPFGYGWDLPIGHIHRSTKWGVPQCTGPSSDAFVLAMPDGVVELVADPPGSNFYRPLLEDRYLRAEKQVATNSWKVTDATGIVYLFGGLPSATVGTSSSFMTTQGGCAFTSAWGLTEVSDPNGNTILVIYGGDEADNVLYPSTISYGGNVSQGLSYFYTVVFDYEARPDHLQTYFGGVPARLTRRVSRIRVRYESSEVRRYNFWYDSDPDELGGFRSILNAVDLEGYGVTQTFVYTASEHHQEATMTAPSGLAHMRRVEAGAQNRGDHLETLLDMNGDGFADIVQSSEGPPPGGPAGSWRVFLGGPAGFASTPLAWTGVPGNSVHLRDVWTAGECIGNEWTCSVRDTFDITGDGIPDRIDARQQGWLVYRGFASSSPGQTGGFESNPISWISPTAFIRTEKSVGQDPFLRHSSTYQDIVDMNGDGLPDLVIADAPGTDDYWHVYLNEGTRFSASPLPWPAPSQVIRQARLSIVDGRVRAEEVFQDLQDMNGDGLPDEVYIEEDQYQNPPNPAEWQFGDPRCNTAERYAECLEVSYNTGFGFADTVLFDVPLVRAFRHSSEAAQYGNQSVTQLELLDVNGDGLVDFVAGGQYANEAWQVLLNHGDGFEELAAVPIDFPGFEMHTIGVYPRLWCAELDQNGACVEGTPGLTGPIRRWNAVTGETFADVFDCNGDGLLDQVTASGGGVWLASLYAGPARPNLLETMRNGIGGTVSIEYTPSTDTLDGNTGGDGIPDLPMVTWLTSAVHFDDGESERTTNYLYTGGRLYRGDPASPYPPLQRREFRGFREVWRVEENGPDDIVAVATTFGQTDTLKGRPIQVDVYAGRAWLEEPYQQVQLELNWWAARPLANHQQVWLATKDVVTFDDSFLPQRITRTQHGTPDEYGNPVFTKAGYSVPWVETHTEYATPQSGSTAFDKPKHTWSVSNGGYRFAEKRFYYDDLPLGQVAKGNLTKVETWLNDGSSSTWVASTMTYDGLGNVLDVVDERGFLTRTQYEPRKLYANRTEREVRHAKVTPPEMPAEFLVTTRTIDLKWGLPSVEFDEAGRATQYEYDAVGRLVKVALPGHDLSDAGCTVKYSYFYGSEDEWSWIGEERKEPNQPNQQRVPTVRRFDPFGRLRETTTDRVVEGALETVRVERVIYDAAGRVSARLDAYDGATTYDYHLNGSEWIDPLGRVYRVTLPDSTFTRTHYAGALTTAFDQEGHKSSARVDGLGRLAETLAYEGETVYKRTTYTYDGAGRVLTVTQNDDPNTTITNTYDTLGRKTTTTDPDSGTWQYGYDAGGNLIHQNDPEPGQHIQFCYDGVGRVEKKYYLTEDLPQSINCADDLDCQPGNPTLACFFYDDTSNGRGRLTDVFDPSGFTGFVHDLRGRVTRVEKGIKVGDAGGSTKTATAIFTYDDVNRMKTVWYPGGEIVETHFDQTGQPIRLTSSQTSVGSYIDGTRYDRLGRITRLEHHNGVVDTRAFYPASGGHRLSRLQTTRGGTAFLDLEYEQYWPRGMIRKVVDHRDAVGVLSNTAEFTYDHLARLTLAQRPIGNHVYAHDAYGNLTRNKNREFTYQPSSPHQVATLKLNGQNLAPLEYDGNGNRAAAQALGHTDYDYDHEDRLLKVIGGTPVEFIYDYTGRRVAVSGDAAAPPVMRYFNEYVETTTAGNAMAKHYFFAGVRVASRQVSAPPGTAALADRAVQFAQVPGELGVLLLLRRDAQVGLGLSLALAAAVLAFSPWKRRRVVGIALRHGHVVLAIVVFAAGTFPVPIVVSPLEGVAWAGGGGPGPVPTPTPGAAEAFVHYHLDHLGSTQVITRGGDGAVVQQIRYDAYERRVRIDHGGNSTEHSYRYEFTGYETETRSGLNYAGARFYDPVLGLFLTHDPAREFSSPYSYGYGDPINTRDPTGASVEGLLVLGFVIAFATTAIQSAVNGASAGQALGNGLVAGLIGAATGPILGVLGGPQGAVAASVSSEAAIAFDVALVGAGAYSTYQGLSTGQYVAGGVGATLLALGAYGLLRRVGQGGYAGRGQLAADPSSLSDAENDVRGRYVLDEVVVEGTPLQGEVHSPWVDPLDIALGVFSGGGAIVFGGMLRSARGAAGRALAGRVVGTQSAANAARLSRQLASEEGVAELLTSGGKAIAGRGTSVPLRDAGKLVNRYGGTRADWAKVTSTAPGHLQTHAYRNVVTGEVVELKSILP